MTFINDHCDIAQLINFYREKELTVSYRQLRSWINAKLLFPKQIGRRNKVFSPNEALWVGIIQCLQLNGWSLKKIRSIRIAIDRKDKGEWAAVYRLLDIQRSTIQELRNQLPNLLDIDSNKEISINLILDKKAFAESLEQQSKQFMRTIAKCKCRSKIRTTRMSRGLSQAQISKALGIAQSRYSRIETGKCKAGNKEKKEIEDFLKIKIDEL